MKGVEGGGVGVHSVGFSGGGSEESFDQLFDLEHGAVDRKIEGALLAAGLEVSEELRVVGEQGEAFSEGGRLGRGEQETVLTMADNFAGAAGAG